MSYQNSPDTGVYLKGIPTCPNCMLAFEDSAPGDVKNYPNDKLFAVFFTCPKCKRESEFYAKYYRVKTT